MNENINLDDIKPGLEEQYNLLCNKEYENFENFSKNHKKRRRLIIILSVVLMFLTIMICSHFYIDISEQMGIMAFILYLDFSLLYYKRDNRKKVADKVQEKLFKFLLPDLYIDKYCVDGIDLQKEYRASMLTIKPYNRYSARNYYKYSLSNGTLVQGIDITVRRQEEKEDSILFGGKLICLKNSVKLYRRIDIMSEREGPTSKINMDSTRFEEKFKVLCDNKNYAYQILTADIMQLIVDFCNKTNIVCNIALEEDNIYIKLSGVYMDLYSNESHNPFNKKTVEYCCKQFKAIADFIEGIANSVGVNS